MEDNTPSKLDKLPSLDFEELAIRSPMFSSRQEKQKLFSSSGNTSIPNCETNDSNEIIRDSKILTGEVELERVDEQRVDEQRIYF